MKRIKAIKLVPTEFVNEARDLREISVLISMGIDVTVITKETNRKCTTYPFEIVRISTRPLSPKVNSPIINRIFSVYIWQRIVRSYNSDIISCHDIICLFIGWLSTLCNKNKAKLVYDSHEFEYARNVRRSKLYSCLIKYFERFLIKKCNLSIMVNETISKEVQILHRLDKKPIVVRNMPNYWKIDNNILNERKIKFKEKYGIKKNDILLIYQGVIMPGRGIEKTLEALQYVDNSFFIILGNVHDSYKSKLEKLINVFLLQERVAFLPAVPHEELWKYTGIADVGLCVIDNICLSYYYSLPNKLFEYIQAQVPVVGSSFPEISNIIDNYNIGRCCNPEDPLSIAKAINDIIQQSQDDILTNNLRIAKENLCWEKESKVLEDAYKYLIEKENGDNR